MGWNSSPKIGLNIGLLESHGRLFMNFTCPVCKKILKSNTLDGILRKHGMRKIGHICPGSGKVGVRISKNDEKRRTPKREYNCNRKV
jgi:hypothetical protein